MSDFEEMIGDELRGHFVERMIPLIDEVYRTGGAREVLRCIMEAWDSRQENSRKAGDD